MTVRRPRGRETQERESEISRAEQASRTSGRSTGRIRSEAGRGEASRRVRLLCSQRPARRNAAF